MRQNERKLSDPKWVVQAHRVVGSELETAAEAVNSGVRFPQPAGEIEREIGGRR